MCLQQNSLLIKYMPCCIYIHLVFPFDVVTVSDVSHVGCHIPRVYSGFKKRVRNLEIPPVLSGNEHEFYLNAGLQVGYMGNPEILF